MAPSPSTRIRSLWARLSPLPGGRWLFSRILGWTVPYTGSIRPLVTHFEPGYARALLRDRRAVRNHLGSVHAIALANLGEVVTGLAVTGAAPAGVRGIPVSLDITFHKKARGSLAAECRCEVPTVSGPVDVPARADIRNRAGEEVATVTAHWRLDLVPTPEEHTHA